MKFLKRIDKRRKILALSAGLVLIGVFYLIIHQVTKADLQENLNSQIKLSQISISSDTDEAVPIGTVELEIPKGESKSFAILLNNSSATAYPDFSIEKTNLENSEGQVISKTAIDERVVHNWTQKVVNYNTTPNGAIEREVDELLVKNEKPAVALPSDPKYNNDPFFSNDITNEMQGLLKSSGSSQREAASSPEKIKTSLGGNSQKKFFFTVKIPQTSQGDYSSVINFVDQSNQSVVAKFNLTVKAAQYTLEKVSDSNLRMGCYTNDQVLADHSNLALFIERMRTIHDYGCEQLVFRINQNVDNLKGLEVISQTGFKGPIILNFASVKNSGLLNMWTYLGTQEEKNQFGQILAGIKNDTNITAPMMFYGIDEPNSTTPEEGYSLSRFEMHKRKTENIKTIVNSLFGSSLPSNVINQVTTSATSTTFDNLFQEDMYKTDYPIVTFKDLYAISQATSVGNYHPQLYETFYFQGYYEINKQHGLFNNNRFLAGLGVLNTGLKGSMLNPTFGYSSTAIRPLYDDFLLTSEMFKGKVWHKQMLTFYPASDGFIPTLQSEGWREGNMDLRYYLSFNKIKDDTSNFSDFKKTELADLKSQIDLQMNKYRISQTAPATKLADNLDDIGMDQTRQLLEAYLNVYYSDSDSTQTGLIESFNLTNGDRINTSPYKLRVEPKVSSQISRAEFYVNGDKVSTVTDLDPDGNYSYDWDTQSETLTSVLVKVILVSLTGEQEEASAQVELDILNSVTPTPSLTPTITASSSVIIGSSVTATSSTIPDDTIAPVIIGVSNLSNYTLVNYDRKINQNHHLFI
jgi:hypothetical protein